MKVSDVARALNKSDQFVRVAVKTSSKYSRHISDALFREYLGGAKNE